MEWCASDSESERAELGRCDQFVPSAKVAARGGKPRWRRLEPDEVGGGGSAIVGRLVEEVYEGSRMAE